MNKVLFPEYNVDYISNVMSLRKPQKQSVKILDSILDDVELSKSVELKNAQDNIHDVYPIFSDFEHSFMSMTFALATGVGKTKLMGAFITYLYTQKGIKNFFVVAPNLTIYKKLKNDLGNPSPTNEKYVFRGVSCFATEHPNVWVDDDYRNRPQRSLFDTDSINIYIFNISKFNSEERNMMDINEYLGQSFFKYLQSLDDLVLIMDESHHYRASKSAEAINSINPVLGLELTATPQVEKGNKTVLFKNVVYEYPLYKAIKDGYTRTPFALTRRDIKAYNLSDEELDKTMINDGVLHHENIKEELKKYSINYNKKLVKPFMLVVCKNTDHAEWVLKYIKSDEFRNGLYKDKVIMVHSNQKGLEKEENINLLLDVEKNTNPIEIVIHVNILKEGWDVNNLYTIVPLRTATSKTLREQTVGRGLRLPFGQRTGEKLLDSVTITAHDKFDEIIAEAQKSDSIFNAEGVIYAEFERQKQVKIVQSSFLDTDEQRQEILKKAGLDFNKAEDVETYRKAVEIITQTTATQIKANPTKKVEKKVVEEKVKEDIGKRFSDNTDLQRVIEIMFGVNTDIVEKVQETEMYLPKLKTESIGNETYIIQDFDLDLSKFSYVPIENEILIKNMLNSLDDAIIVRNGVIDFNTIKPEKYLVDEIRQIGEIDYEKCPSLIQKIVLQFLNHYRAKYSEDKVRNICIMYKMDIVNKFKEQLLQHLAVKYEGLVETAYGIETLIRNYAIDYSHGVKNINEEPDTTISSIVYEGAKRSVTQQFKFDSNPERLFALACENSPEVVRWLRPAPKQFNITYNRGKRYEPDFVVETKDMYYLVEVKDKRRLEDIDVVAKKDRALQYCRIASEYNKANGHKEFRYLFIPHDEVSSNSSFNNLMLRFIK
ncbi:MAG: DEAD/DEAH box helicase family protein [Clostridia bacterium]|nr:DEAD/DEAH box helicase family protein [Clostridia bacterium]